MKFFLSYDNGYIVECYPVWFKGYMRCKPLRKFKEQGHAIEFKLYDCPHFSEEEVNRFISSYNSKLSFYRFGFKKYRL